MGDRMGMKKLMLVAVLLSLPSCATLQAINESKAKADARKVAQKEFAANLDEAAAGKSFYAHFLHSLPFDEKMRKGWLESRDLSSDAVGREIVLPGELIERIGVISPLVAKQMGVAAGEYCKASKNSCAEMKPYISRALKIGACDEGDGKACLQLAMDQEKANGPLVLDYYKQACSNNNQAGCTMYQTAMAERAAERQARAQEAMLYEQQEANRNAAAANAMSAFSSSQRGVAQQPAFVPVQTRQRMNCTSQRFGNQVQTNCY